LRGADLSARQRAKAAWLWSHRQGVLAGLSAAATLSAKWVDADVPAQLVHTNRRAPPMIIVNTYELLPGETRRVDGMLVTTPQRTAFDIGRRLELPAGVQSVDALMNATDVKVVDVEAVDARHPGVRGLTRLQRTLALVDGGSESPYESLTRLVLAQAGFPPIKTQIEVSDCYAEVFARLDMGWPEYLVAVEFDGAQHWTDARQCTWDIDRLAKLQEMGWLIIRVSAGLLHGRPQVLVARVGAALAARGCPKTW
jgi:hypothetical protein